MITTRERISISELAAGLLRRQRLPDALQTVLPLGEGRQCVFTSQGKAAFEQIVLAAKLAGARVLLPAFFPDDFVGVFRKYRITPVFIDVDSHTYHIDTGRITARQLDGARALIVLHTFGLPLDGSAIRTFCDEHGLVMIEDCARALGAKTKAGRLAGSFGHYALYSLPKCTPVRQGGVMLAETPFEPALGDARIGLSGLLHALTLVRYPLCSLVEGPFYRLVANSRIYPGEVGNYDPLPARRFDSLGRFVLESFMPRYPRALEKKRECALRIRKALENDGFTFQADGAEHIYTALATDPPPDCDSDLLKGYLLKHGVKATAMWRNALGVSEFARKEWNAVPEESPVALHLSRRLIQLPVSRFQTPDQSETIVSLCRRFVSLSPRQGAATCTTRTDLREQAHSI